MRGGGGGGASFHHQDPEPVQTRENTDSLRMLTEGDRYLILVFLQREEPLRQRRGGGSCKQQPGISFV